MALFIFFYGVMLLVFSMVLLNISEIGKKRKNVYSQTKIINNKKVIKDADLDFASAFEKKYNNIASSLPGYIRKEYLDYYLANEALKKDEHIGVLIKIIPTDKKLTEDEAFTCGKIINIEFNGNAILACKEQEELPNYNFYIYLPDLTKEDSEIFVMNAVYKVIENTGKMFNFSINQI